MRAIFTPYVSARRFYRGRSRAIQRGVGLIELLVGVLLGLIGSIAIFQILNVASGTSRTTADAADAQMSGALAIYRVARDIQLGGYGLSKMPMNLIDCTVNFANSTVTGTFRLAPVNATFGAGVTAGMSGDPDELHLMIGTAANSVEAVSLSVGDLTSSTVSSRAGFAPGDVAMFMQSGGSPRNCELRTITSRPPATPGVLEHAGGGARFRGVTAFTPSDLVVNVGAQPRVVTWRLDPASRRLVVVDLLQPGQEVEAATGVVDMQVQLGIDGIDGSAPNNGIEATEWFDAPATALTPDQLARVLAVRVAILLQGMHYERDEVTTNEPTWNGGTRFRMPAGAEWRHFRYRVYETTTSLRNVIWNR